MNEHTGDDRQRRAGRRFAVLAVVLAAFAALVWFAGGEEVLDALADLRPREAAVLLAAGLLPLLLWGVELKLVLAGLDADVGPGLAVALVVAAGFLNNVTPFGEVGGDPPGGLLIARVCRIPFERGLAAIVGVNAVNRVAVVALGAVGVAWLGLDAGAADWGWALVDALAVWSALAAVVVAGWRYREMVVETIAPPLAAATVRVGRRLPAVSAPTESAVEGRVRGFVAAIERLVADPPRLVAALLVGAAGHLAVVATLWLALAALGARASAPALLVVIPLARLSGLSPTPGGSGGASVLVAGLLVAVAGVPTATAAAVALLYRAAAFWVPTTVGALVTAGLVARVRAE